MWEYFDLRRALVLADRSRGKIADRPDFGYQPERFFPPFRKGRQLPCPIPNCVPLPSSPHAQRSERGKRFWCIQLEDQSALQVCWHFLTEDFRFDVNRCEWL